jgi:hypothetical protein
MFPEGCLLPLQDLPEHEHFKTLLEAPRTQADTLMKDRLPVPRLVECDQVNIALSSRDQSMLS